MTLLLLTTASPAAAEVSVLLSCPGAGVGKTGGKKLGEAGIDTAIQVPRSRALKQFSR